MKREEGYYWVCQDLSVEDWRIGYWSNEEVGWILSPLEHIFDDDDFEEIDERKIERQPYQYSFDKKSKNDLDN